MKLRLGDRIECIKNALPDFWWEFKVGDIYIVQKGTAINPGTNRPYPFALKTGNGVVGRENWIVDAEDFFKQYGQYGERPVAGSLNFRIVDNPNEEFE